MALKPVFIQSFIRVQGLNGEWVSVNIAGAVDGIQIRDTIYAAFNITDERSKDEYVIFRKEISSSGSCKCFDVKYHIYTQF